MAATVRQLAFLWLLASDAVEHTFDRFARRLICRKTADMRSEG
jgi:hypothetical protein